MKKGRIYTGIDAGELQELLDEGYTLKGVFGDTKKELEQNRVKYGAWELDGIDSEDTEKRFHVKDYGTPYAFFVLDDVQEWTYYTPDDTKELRELEGKRVMIKPQMVLTSTVHPEVFKIGTVTIGLTELFDFFVFRNLQPIGKKRSALWREL